MGTLSLGNLNCGILKKGDRESSSRTPKSQGGGIDPIHISFLLLFLNPYKVFC